ncbi:hypothetical protein [uncultured Tateyamaria sp.]|uniref:hypothetical protein n=1 Tax=uncultured Tateyamaria sp. TaxID=455651 RepID=UPI002602D5EA|nr:hypothetical protein [uncultured Tateyamaria sp.]
MPTELDALKMRVRAKVVQSGLSLADAGIRAGKSKTWLSSWLRSSSTVEPGAVALANLAAALNCGIAELYGEPTSPTSTNYVSGPMQSVARLMEISNAQTRQAIQILNRQSASTVLDAWLSTNGQIDNRFDHLWDYFDILEPGQDDGPPRVTHMGRSSLAANALESTEITKFQSFLNNLEKDDRDEVNGSLSTVLNGSRGTVTNPRRTVHLDGTTSKTVDFVRLHLPGTIRDGSSTEKRVVINIAHYF